MKIRVAEDVRFPYAQFGAWRTEMLDQALSFPNPARERAMKEMVPGWHMHPKNLHLLRKERGEIVIPRGYLHTLLAGLDATGIKNPEIIDETVSVPIDTSKWLEPTLREDQIPAVYALLENRIGCFKGPTASGKTVVVLAAIRSAQERALVIVNRSDLARQWIERAKTHLRRKVGLFGAGKNSELDAEIIVATQQTLWSQVDWLDEIDFWSQFGFVCVDETHHCKAETYMEIVSRFPSKYRVGVSATPDHDPALYPYVEAMVGPIVYEIEPEDAINKGVILKGKVIAVGTDFIFPDYVATHRHDKCPGAECPYYGTEGKRGVHRNNYGDLIDALISNEDRNRLVAETIAGCDARRVHVVLSRRLAHLDAILDELVGLGYPPALLRRLTGKEKTAEKQEIQNFFALQAGAVILTTIADEGIDVPRLDTIHLPYPGRNPEVTRQQVGRIRRLHETKCEPLVFDYVDRKVGPLKQQYYSRKRGFYDIEKMEVTRR